MKILLRAAHCLLLATAALSAAVVPPGLNPDGLTDNTDALQAALGSGNLTLELPPGTYLLGTLRIPANTTLRAASGAKIRINPERLGPPAADSGQKKKRNPKPVHPLLLLAGDNITLDGLDFDFTLTEADDILPEKRPLSLIHGANISRVRLLNLTAERPEPAPPLPLAERRTGGISRGRYPPLPANKAAFSLATFADSSDLLLRDSRARFMHSMIGLLRCSGIAVENNRAENGWAITDAAQASRYLRHTGNWSSEVSHQCRWSGGNANDRRNLNPDHPGWGTAATVERHTPPLLPGQPGFNQYTTGAYDIIVANNYAEYGITLSWGAKGRQILFQGNIARFMTDYALGSEGGENVVFNGNLVINSFTAGLVTMYWTEKVVMTGNTVLVRDEPVDDRRSWYATPAPYHGGFIRLHAAGGAPETSGAGQVIITGNLFSSEFTDRPRALLIDAGRDVLITGNKIRNGHIRAKDNNAREHRSRVSILGNDFTMTAPFGGAWLDIRPRVASAIVKDNAFLNTRPLETRSPTESLLLAEANSTLTRGQPFPRLRVIQDNLIQGFPLALWARSHSTKSDIPDRFLITGNTTDGAIRFEGLRATVRLAADGNRDLATLQPLKLEILERVPEPLPPPAPTPDDEAGALSEGLPAGDDPGI